MNWVEVVRVIDTEVFNKIQRHLKEVEKIVLHGAWQGKTYEQMEETCQYSLSYLKQAAGPRLWKLLSEVFEENISKTNFRVVLERWTQQQLAGSELELELLPKNEAVREQNWQEASEISLLYGRDRELKQLQQWIIRDRCRLLTVYGMGGIGKTTLASHFARQAKSQFEQVIWRSLHYVSGTAELVNQLLHCFTNDSKIEAESLDSQISTLIEHLRRDKCLIILDTATEIWQSGDLAGHYRKQYKEYGELLQRLATEAHQSCLLLCTRQKPREIAFLEGDCVPVRSLHLGGLTSQARHIFQEKRLLNEERWDELIELYRGNPLALKIVANTIQELFGGSVSSFLQQDTIVYGDIYDLLEEQFERLSSSEQEILNWLAIAHYPLSLVQLKSNILLPINTAELIEALESLLRRSFISKDVANGETRFSLHQPIVTQYAIERSIERVCEETIEINNSKNLSDLEFLRNYALVTHDPEIRKFQIRKILTPIKNKLYRTFRDESAIEACLQAILLLLKNKTPLTVGYAKQNVEFLLEELQSDLNSQTSVSP